MVASLGMALYTFLCPVAAKLSTRFGCRVVMVCGGLTSALGLLGSSFAPNLDVLYLSFGVMVGIASSLVYMAAFQIVPLYFDKHRDIATAMASLGPGAGVLVMSPVIQTLLKRFDWRKALLALAGINLLPSILGCSIMRKNKKTVNDNEDTRKTSESRCCRILQILDCSILKNPSFVILTLSGVVTQLGYMIPYVHLVGFSFFMSK